LLLSALDPDTNYLEVYHGFLSPSRQNAGIVP
jgi:hypothetical protein